MLTVPGDWTGSVKRASFPWLSVTASQPRLHMVVGQVTVQQVMVGRGGCQEVLRTVPMRGVDGAVWVHEITIKALALAGWHAAGTRVTPYLWGATRNGAFWPQSRCLPWKRRGVDWCLPQWRVQPGSGLVSILHSHRWRKATLRSLLTSSINNWRTVLTIDIHLWRLAVWGSSAETIWGSLHFNEIQCLSHQVNVGSVLPSTL